MVRTRPAPFPGSRTRSALLALALAAGGLASSVGAQPAPGRPAPVQTATAAGPAWGSLSAQQKNVLAPLQRDWDQLDAQRKTKWMEIADRFPRLSAPEQARIHDRMTTWARMTPDERARARQNYKEAQQLSPQERKARWEAYRALPPDRRKELAAQGAPAGAPEPGKGRRERQAERESLTKSNIVPGAPTYAPAPQPVTPAVTQARPGATTNPISKRASPPAHQQAGQPKIAATPGFVDQDTLLPQRGPQGAAAQPRGERERRPRSAP